MANSAEEVEKTESENTAAERGPEKPAAGEKLTLESIEAMAKSILGSTRRTSEPVLHPDRKIEASVAGVGASSDAAEVLKAQVAPFVEETRRVVAGETAAITAQVDRAKPAAPEAVAADRKLSPADQALETIKERSAADAATARGEVIVDGKKVSIASLDGDPEQAKKIDLTREGSLRNVDILLEKGLVSPEALLAAIPENNRGLLIMANIPLAALTSLAEGSMGPQFSAKIERMVEQYGTSLHESQPNTEEATLLAATLRIPRAGGYIKQYGIASKAMEVSKRFREAAQKNPSGEAAKLIAQNGLSAMFEGGHRIGINREILLSMLREASKVANAPTFQTLAREVIALQRDGKISSVEAEEIIKGSPEYGKLGSV